MPASQPPRFTASARGLRLHRPRSSTRARLATGAQMLVSDLILAVLGVAMLGGIALAMLCSLAAGAAAP